MIARGLNQDVIISVQKVGYGNWLIASGAIGGLLAVIISREWFGRPGFMGVMRAMAGTAYATVLVGLIAGTLALPFYGTMFGPFALVITLAGGTKLLAVWLLMFAAVHALFRVWQAERESIFSPIPA